MKPFITHIGTAVVLDHANIDTDQIIPKQFLSKVTRDGFGIHLFHDWRYLDADGNIPNLEFALNKKEHIGASILITKENFGCGSSREHAPWALADFGFKAIIAISFADIFYANSINNGLLPISLKAQEIESIINIINADPSIKIDIDLTRCTVSIASVSFNFTIAKALQDKLLQGLDAIGETLTHVKDIAEFESNLPKWRSLK